MFTTKSIFRMLSVLLIVVFLLTGALPAQAESLASPVYASGDFVWAQAIGGVGDDFGNSIATDSSGNVYTTGAFQDIVDFDPGAGTLNLTSAGLTDVFITKMDGNGNLIWARSISAGTVDDELSSFDIVVDPSFNVYTTGYFTGTADFDPSVNTFTLTSAGGGDAFVSKLDSNGNFVWAKNMGGASFEAGNGIAIDSSINIYTTGFFQVPADFDPGIGVFNLIPVGGTDIFVSKLDSNGDFVWAKSMGGTSGDFGAGIAVDSGNNVSIVGRFQSTVDFDPGGNTFNLTSAGLRDAFISKLDSSGNFVWAKSMGGLGNDLGNDIALDSGSNIYTTGEFDGTVDFDPGAGTVNLTSAGGSDIFVSKLDSSGNFVWAKSMGGASAQSGSDIAVDSSSNVYTTGYFFEDTVDFDPGAGIFSLTTVGLEDVFVSKLDGSGNFVWAKSISGAGTEIGNGIALDANNNVYTTGYFDGTADFDPGAGTADLTSAGISDIFISRLVGSSDQVTLVTIDIIPTRLINTINLAHDRFIPVAILSTSDFKAPKVIKRDSLTFGKTGDEDSLVLCLKPGVDVNHDRLPDLICFFRVNKTGFQEGDVLGILKGQTLEGIFFEGGDLVKIVKPKK